MFKIFSLSFICLFFLSSFVNLSQTTENTINVVVPTSFGDFTIIKEEKITINKKFDNKRQSFNDSKEISSKVYVQVNKLKLTNEVSTDLKDYKNYNEDIYVVLTFDKTGKVLSFKFLQESVLSSFNAFYNQLLNEVLKKMKSTDSKKIIDLTTQTTLKVKLTYTK
jgi:hypothetical protein